MPHRLSARSLPVALAALALAVAPDLARAQAQCQAVAPWINEIDYDSFDSGGLNEDRDEFVEIAAAAGTDLGGYRVLMVEGNSSPPFSLPCWSGFGTWTGNAYWDLAIPAGTVVGDDTGGGIGFLTVCLANTSTDVVAQGACDVVLPAPATDSNIKNGSLTDPAGNCPDGVLILDPQGGYVDAVQYEGTVGNERTYGHFFHPPYLGYSIPFDPGWQVHQSVSKVTDTTAPATATTEWVLNEGQDLVCLNNVDSDGDGVFDHEDNCTATPNPLQEDADGDGLGDVCDNCPDDANPGQEDGDGFEDGDGVGDACECNPNPGPGHVEVTYDLSATYFEITNTPLGLGDLPPTLIGPGSMTVRYENDGLGAILDGGPASIVQFDMAQEFAVGNNPHVVTDIDASIPDDRWDGNPQGVVNPGSNGGTLVGTTVTFDGDLQNYHTEGFILCTGGLCSLGGLPDGVADPVNETDTLALPAIFLSPDTGAGHGFSADPIQFDDPNADPFLTLGGAETGRVVVPGLPGEICIVDSDGDGWPDEEDNCPNTSNGSQSDVNGDGIGDACQPDDADGDGWPDVDDNCPADPNADQSDLNGDGIGDVCQPDDADGDGWPDAEDVCPGLPSPDQTDTDGDGVGDLCDICVDVWDPDQIDSDFDIIGDACDVCPGIPDFGQEDADGDGAGDICDVCNGVFDPGQEDGDGDGVGDACDLCPLDVDPGQEDADGDGAGDVCDDPCDNGADDDQDGLADLDDPGCFDATWPLENPQCNDGLDNDGDGFVDFGPEGVGDPQCNQPYTNREAAGNGCGVGGLELLPLGLGLVALRRRRA